MEQTRRHYVDSVSGPVDQRCLITISVAIDDATYVDQIIAAFAQTPLAHVMFFASPNCDFRALSDALQSSFSCPVVGCTSAGEISADGFLEDHVVVVGLPKSLFAARTVVIDDLSATDFNVLNDRLIQNRLALTAANPDMPNGFCFLMIDGLSGLEDQFVSTISPSLAGFPLFGGSAGDGLRFERADVSANGQVYENAATLTFIVTNCDVSVFSINHMVPSDLRMVVTQANPQARTVCGINDEPAAAEYARLIGKDPNQLDELIFAENPVTVRVGDQYHVRAIQSVNSDGHLLFFSAIDEGMVLTMAQPLDMAEHLGTELSQLTGGAPNADILACDCVLRRVEAQKSQSQHKMNAVFRKHSVVGFSTYGEQIGPLHVNHTLTGVALIPPVRGN